MRAFAAWFMAMAVGPAVAPAVFGDDAWPACTVGWEAPAQPAASDVSFLLEAPAGKDSK